VRGTRVNGVRRVAAAFVVMACAGGILHSAEDPSGAAPATDSKAFEELLDVTGVFASARVATDTMIQRLQQENPVVPADVWSNFAGKVADRDTLSALYVPIYAQHLSEADARGIVTFYRTSTGEHLLSALAKIQEDCRDAAQAWAADVATDLMDTGADPSNKKHAGPPRQSRQNADTAREDAIHELLRASGAVGQARQTMTLMIDRIQHTPQASELPASFWQAARERLTNEADLLRLWTPAYAHQLADGDVRAITDFYRSPLGTRYVAALPAIQRESVEAATKLANDAARRAIREVLGPLPQWRLQHPQSPR
jgi:hypothetical protein